MTSLQHVLYAFGNGVLYVATMAILLVIAYYWLTARWWKKPEGRHVMAWNAWACIILAYLSGRAIFGPRPHTDTSLLLIRIAVFATGLALFLWRGLLIAKAQAVKHDDAAALLNEAFKPDSPIPPNER